MGTFYSQSTTFNIDVEFKDDLNKGIISEKLKKIFKTEDYSLSENAIVTKEKEDKWRITDREKIYIVKKEEGTLNIYNPTTFVHEADFGSARIGGNAEFPGVKFGGDTDFVSARIGGNAEFPGVKFGGDTDFGSARIGGVAEFRGAEFKQLATFSRAQIEESAFFNQATFWGEANFVSARIGSNAEFRGAEFKQLATFNSAQIEGAAFFNHAYLFIIEVEFKDDLNKGIISEKLKKIFKAEGFSISENAIVTKEKDDKWRITDREKIYIVKKEDEKLNIYNPTTFVDEADFGSARIGGTAEFQEATFTERAIFNGAQIGGVFFDPATFEAEANFVSARIGSNAEFQGAEFKQLATFNRAQIEESAFFNQATFWGEANFVSAQIGSRAKFIGAEFKQQAKFNSAKIEGDALFKSAIFEDEADFVSARIGSTAHFTGAEFKQQAIFNSAQIERESHFEGTVFANDVSFQDSSLKTVFWGEPNVQFNKNIDLRGCIYDRIQPITFWKQLMEHLGPYDRQPFTQLEETFRRAGKDKLADDVYYKRKCQEYTENIAIRMYLFSWDCVPGDDDEKLRKFLEDDLDP
jgi:DNA-binding transcriptional ArsR family regulator